MFGEDGHVASCMQLVHAGRTNQMNTISRTLGDGHSSFSTDFFLILGFGTGLVLMGHSKLFEEEAFTVVYPGVTSSSCFMFQVTRYGFYLCPFLSLTPCDLYSSDNSMGKFI